VSLLTENLHHETKLLLPAERAPLVAGLLARLCRADDDHPESEVVSLYFDTPDLASYRQKRASEYLKTKWRVRWYRVGGATVEPAFVERKDRVGTRRSKRRVPATIPASVLDRLALAGARPFELLAPLRDAGEGVPATLLPCLRLEYRRQRFVDGATGTRLSLDVEIRATAVHPGFWAFRDPRPLGVAVLELKGPARRLPPHLQPLTAAGCRRASFSKYAAVLERHLPARLVA
jgi:hypothetical protein